MMDPHTGSILRRFRVGELVTTPDGGGTVLHAEYNGAIIRLLTGTTAFYGFSALERFTPYAECRSDLSEAQMTAIVQRMQAAAGISAPSSSKKCDRCEYPASGGECSRCGYPVAYTHPTNLLEAFDVEAIWIGGTAIPVHPCPDIQPGVVRICRNWFFSEEYPIPPASLEKDHTPMPPSSPVPPSEGLDIQTQIYLISTAAKLLLGSDRSASEVELSTAIIKGLSALTDGWLMSSDREVLERFLSSGTPRQETRLAVQALLQEVDRSAIREQGLRAGLVMDDWRPHRVICREIGPLAQAFSRLRIALLPGEADHVDLYDIRIGKQQDRPLGISVITRLPGYSPEAVREVPDPVSIQGTLIRKYLPGTTLAGQLRDGADPLDTWSPEDLQGGGELDLGCTFPPMSYVYLYYRVAPGHIFCAAVEPIAIVAPADQPSRATTPCQS